MTALKNILSEPNPNTKILTVADQYEGKDAAIAAVCYFYFVSGLVLLLRKGNSEFVSFHARQAFVLLIIDILIFLFSGSTLRLPLSLLLFVLNCFGAWQALRRKHWQIPLITDLANSIEI